jgi:hypothetical protein
MGYSPPRNHWWHVTQSVTTRGLTTGPIPFGGVTFDVSFDLVENALVVTTSEGGAFSFALDDLPVAEFIASSSGARVARDRGLDRPQAL